MTQAAKNDPAPVLGSEAAHIAAGLDPKDLKYLSTMSGGKSFRGDPSNNLTGAYSV
jgi:hypothetical protein